MNPRFIADSMLGNIARKLRVFGYDVEFVLDADDNYFVHSRIYDKKIVLTRDKQLSLRLKHKNLTCILLSSYSEYDNLVYIMKKCGINRIDFVPTTRTRCSKCNGELFAKDKSLYLGAIPAKVYENVNLIYECNICSKIYWIGTHVKNMNWMISQINTSLILN